MDISDFNTDDNDLLEEIKDAGETRLEAQLKAALAADQRALSLARFTVTAAVVFASASIALLIDEKKDIFLALIGFFAAIGMMISTAFSVYAARPTNWYFPGLEPICWATDIKSKTPKNMRLRKLVVDLQEYVSDNEKIMKRNKQAFFISSIAAVITLVLAAAMLLARLV